MNSIKNFICVVILSLISVALYFSVQHNSFRVVLPAIHDNYQRESESLVLGKLFAEKNDIDTKGWRLGYIAPRETGSADILYPYTNFEKRPTDNINFIPYVSQFGIQSVIFESIENIFSVHDIQGLKKINSIIFVVTIFILALLYSRLFNLYFSIIFASTFVLSPWIVPIARNLYWVPFTWFLPAIFSTAYFLCKSKTSRYIMLAMVFISFAIKCMAGYEYLTSVTLLVCAPAVLLSIFDKKALRYNVSDFIVLFILCVAAFIFALMVHANLRGNSLLNGLHNIFEYDVKRRTYGEASNFANAEIQKSLTVSPWFVLNIYLSEWTTDIIKHVSGNLFPWFLALSGIIALLSRNLKIIFSWIYGLAIPLSWYVLAKGHSEVHVFINFVLWYLLTLPLMVYIVLLCVKNAIAALFSGILNKRSLRIKTNH